MKTEKSRSAHKFGTAPVFLAAICTILGAILFLRFGYAVAHAGMLGAILIILIGHLITIPTALAIAEISTNLKVEGGGEYFMISRSFGLLIGGTIGISLYLSQAISVAFYMIAFSEAFKPLFAIIQENIGFIPEVWMISLPATVLLLLIILIKGANIGVKVLWGVAAVLAVSLVMFFLGQTNYTPGTINITEKVANHDDFFLVFAIIFPAFTGMTAGVGLSGDLKSPRRSIPLGTLSATIFGMIVYIFVVMKLSGSLPVEQLAGEQFVMSRIAIWGPVIPIGLGAATLSSAIGSILIAPRTMQALAKDTIFPIEPVNRFLGKGKGESNEPFNATILTAVIVLVFVSMGSIDFVAQIISMFFMITYGTLCLVSFFEHFAGNPSYRPTFRSKWYLSLLGAVCCFIIMFQMSPLYAAIAIVGIIIIYVYIKRGHAGDYGLSDMLKGVLFQLTRKLQIIIQQQQADLTIANWRPSFIAVSSSTFSRLAPFDLLRWISHYYGFGTFIHYIKGMLNEETRQDAENKLDQLIKMGTASHAGIYVDTIISPSFKTAIAQILQIPGISGMDHNSILFEFLGEKTDDISNIIEGCQFGIIMDYNICVLRSSERHFGYKRNIHIWLTPGDYKNVNLMIILAYIIIGHPEWKNCEIKIFIAFQKKELNKEVRHLNELIDNGRIPISNKNIQQVPWNKKVKSYENLVTEHSEESDLVMMGFSVDKLTQEKGTFFRMFPKIKDIVFVRANQKIVLSDKAYKLKK